MKCSTALLFAVCVLIFTPTGSPCAADNVGLTSTSLEARELTPMGQQWYEDVLHEHIRKSVTAPSLANALVGQRLHNAANMLKSLGTLRSIGYQDKQHIHGDVVYLFHLQLAHGELREVVSVNMDCRTDGIWFLPWTSSGR